MISHRFGLQTVPIKAWLRNEILTIVCSHQGNFVGQFFRGVIVQSRGRACRRKTFSPTVRDDCPGGESVRSSSTASASDVVSVLRQTLHPENGLRPAPAGEWRPQLESFEPRQKNEHLHRPESGRRGCSLPHPLGSDVPCDLPLA